MAFRELSAARNVDYLDRGLVFSPSPTLEADGYSVRALIGTGHEG